MAPLFGRLFSLHVHNFGCAGKEERGSRWQELVCVGGEGGGGLFIYNLLRSIENLRWIPAKSQ